MYRAGGILIQDGKLLVVTGFEETAWWSPGGRIDPGETGEQALARELNEELGIQATKLQYYCSFQAIHTSQTEMREFGYYLVEWEGVPVPQEDITKLFWLSKEDYDRKLLPMPETLQDMLIPRLISEGLIT